MVKTLVNTETEKRTCFWPVAATILIILVLTMTRGMPRPFGGMHSWADASGAWAARAHVNYGLSYTKGMTTWAVGNPPTENPKRYNDHPQLAVLTVALFMKIFGVSEFSYQFLNVLMSITTFIIILKIFKGLLDEKAALIAGLLYVLFPLTGFFGTGGFPNLFGYLAIYAYIALTGRIDAKGSKKLYSYLLAISLFMSLQFGWTGFFFGMAIGFDYIFQCIIKKKMPEFKMLAILAGAPLGSLALNFIIMAAGYGWDFSKIVDLYRWRSSKGEMPEFVWGLWFEKMWLHASTNFTLPVLIIVILYFTIGQLVVFAQPKNQQTPSRRFPCFWIFFLLPFFQLFILKGALWQHQTWEFPLSGLIAIAAAQASMLIVDLIARINKKYSIAALVIITGMFVTASVMGTNYYFKVRWQPDAKIDMFKMLNSRIPPDKYLLSFDPFVVNQHAAKGAFYRPEIAWYLDREIVQAVRLDEIIQAAKTGKYPFYLLPMSVGDPQADAYISELSKQLSQLYKYEYIPGVSGEADKKGRFLKAGMSNYLLFDLQKPLK